MKFINLITGSDLRMVMGVNYYLKSFILCNSYFENVKVNRLFSGSQSLKIDEGEEIPIGYDIGTKEYKFRRAIRTFLRHILTDKFYPFALFRYQTNLNVVSKGAINRFFKDDAPCDYVIFQEIGVAEYYFKQKDKYPKAKKIKTLLVIHGSNDTCESTLASFKGFGYKDMKSRLIKRRDYVYSHVDKVMYISQNAYDNSILSLEKKAFVYNGSQAIDYSFIEKKEQIIQLVCVGSITGAKGQDVVIEAMSKMDDKYLNQVHFTIVGGGSKFEETKKLTNLLKMNRYVTLLGIRNDVPEILKGMDIFIMPSKTEGLSMSAIEAMRAGLYLVLTDTGGNKELCDDGCGVICTRDPENIKEILYKVIDEKRINKRQKELSHNRFMRIFSTESMAKGYEKTLLSL